MEDGVYHSLQTLQAPGYVLWAVQLTTHLSSLHGLHFRRYDCQGWLIIYMDDVLVYTEMLEECQEWTKRVPEWMKEEDLHLKLTKCAFEQTEVEYLGLVVKNGEVLMDPIKLKAVKDWEPSTSVKAVRSFIRFCNFYQKFISNFSVLA